MTTRRELGEMLITGKPLQHRVWHDQDSELSRDQWSDMPEDTGVNTHVMEYRLKPVTTYYRVYTFKGDLRTDYSKSPFPDLVTWNTESFSSIGNVDHIHDFEKESS